MLLAALRRPAMRAFLFWKTIDRMISNKLIQLVCPLDGLSLDAHERSFVCASGHRFDVARQGYLNLLPVQQKRSKFPGDSVEMIAARQRFLMAGFYDRIADQLIEMLNNHVQLNNEMCLLDAGCGDGFYLEYLSRVLLKEDIQPGLVGLDISKSAIIAAARRNKNITWLVASNKQPPLLPQSVDVIVCMFGFPVFDAFKNILKPGGKLLLVEAGPQHLIELRRMIYAEIKQTGLPDLSAAEQSGFELLAQNVVVYKTASLEPVQIADLLLMTPHMFRACQAGKQRAAELNQIELTVDVSLRLLQLNG